MHERAVRVLILGGYGVFGGRLAKLLADEPRVELLIAGRSLAKAQRFCDELALGPRYRPAEVDRDSDLLQRLAALRPDVLVDATGPFQAYGDDAYRVVRACLQLRIHYLDFADGADFVEGIAQFDAEARERGLFVLTGVSSFPVLTAAVVRRLAASLREVHTVRCGIAPSPFANVGANVIRAIAGYAGQRISLRRDARVSVAYPLTETMRYTIAPPGYLPLRNLLFSLVEVPDLRLLPKRWPNVRTVWAGAAPVPAVLHRLLIALAWLVRLRLLPSLRSLAPLMYRAIQVLHWGEHRGGMFVEIEGIDAARKPTRCAWHLVAERDRGPFIPSMAIELILRRYVAGTQPVAGARAATAELELSDYERLFAARDIHTGVVLPEQQAHLFRLLLGEAWHRLPRPIQAMHECPLAQRAAGLSTVERGRGLRARFLAWVFNLPNAGAQIPVEVQFELRGEPPTQSQVWRRTFNGRSFTSVHTAGAGRNDRLLCERFGPFVFALALVVRDEELLYIVRRWTVWGVPLPRRWMPHAHAYEFVRHGRFHFHVDLSMPGVGAIVQYRGWLEPVLRQASVTETAAACTRAPTYDRPDLQSDART